MQTALIQYNPIVGDLKGNVANMSELAQQARMQGAELIVFPELAICGYPPRDLLLHEGFIESCVESSKSFGTTHSQECVLIFGTPLPVDNTNPKMGIANSLMAWHNGTLLDTYDKRLLPTYDVFDEDRYFEPGNRAVVIEVPTAHGCCRVGLSICEDLWKGEDAGFALRYRNEPDPVDQVVKAGAEVLISPSASPFVMGKGARHRAILQRHARTYGIAVASVNQVGGNDDLVFDGHSACFDSHGKPLAFGPGFATAITMVDLPAKAEPAAHNENQHAPNALIDPLLEADEMALLFEALVVGTRDYVHKTGHHDAIVGLSGGIDSALTAAIAVRALGASHVLGVAMPGRYSSGHSVEDAQELAKRLGMPCLTIPIAEPFDGFGHALEPAFEQLNEPALGVQLPDLAEENLQSRVRGCILMTLSNRTGALVLTTGNKSELAVGYCTLYGDMNGGLAVLSDVPKMQVFALSRWINANHVKAGFKSAPIPQRTIDKPPSAELAPDQLDTDSLPPYEVLDEIIRRYVEAKQSRSTIVQQTGFDQSLVDRITRLIDINEYKRKQYAVGIKVRSIAFGSGRRVPIVQRWRSP